MTTLQRLQGTLRCRVRWLCQRCCGWWWLVPPKPGKATVTQDSTECSTTA